MRSARVLWILACTALAVGCGGIARPRSMSALLPAKGRFENWALADKGAWAHATETLAGTPRLRVRDVFAWPGMRDTLSPHEQAVLSVIDGSTAGGYWASYEMGVSSLTPGKDMSDFCQAPRWADLAPNYIEVTFPRCIQLSRVVVHTVETPTAVQATKVALEAYTLSYLNHDMDPPSWVDLVTVGGNQDLRRVHDFAPVNTWKLRLTLTASSYFSAGWVDGETQGQREYKFPKVSEIEAFGVALNTDEPPPPRPQPQKPPEPAVRRELLYYISPEGDTTLVNPHSLKPVSKDSLARIREARAAKPNTTGRSEVFVLDPRGDVTDEDTGLTHDLPQIDLINARCLLEGDKYTFTLTVAGKIVGKGGELTGTKCEYGFHLDTDGDGQWDLSCLRRTLFYLHDPVLEGGYLDADGTQHEFQEGIIPVTLVRNTLGLLVPDRYIGRIDSFERARLKAFARMDRIVDTCGP